MSELVQWYSVDSGILGLSKAMFILKAKDLNIEPSVRLFLLVSHFHSRLQHYPDLSKDIKGLQISILACSTISGATYPVDPKIKKYTPDYLPMIFPPQTTLFSYTALPSKADDKKIFLFFSLLKNSCYHSEN